MLVPPSPAGCVVGPSGAHEGSPTIHGLTILEVRDGKIGRETIFSDHLRTRY
jgi:hypothetical protein